MKDLIKAISKEIENSIDNQNYEALIGASTYAEESKFLTVDEYIKIFRDFKFQSFYNIILEVIKNKDFDIDNDLIILNNKILKRFDLTENNIPDKFKKTFKVVDNELYDNDKIILIKSSKFTND